MIRSSFSSFFGVFFAFLALTALPLHSVAQTATKGPGYSVRAGDRISISLYTAAGADVSVVNGERTVDPNGEVFLPYVKTVHVAGMNQTEIRELLTELYSTYYTDPVLEVEVRLRVSVTGAVVTAGQYYVHPTATILDAITQAGGMYSEYAVTTIQIPSDQSRVRLVREGVTTILNLRPEEVSDAVLDMPVQSGDWIDIPFRSRSRVRDEITFWGTIVGFASNLVALVVLLSR